MRVRVRVLVRVHCSTKRCHIREGCYVCNTVVDAAAPQKSVRQLPVATTHAPEKVPSTPDATA